ncbi:MAG: hypothetical protein AAFX03_02840 [Pseudomonadota bacterium]
MSDIEWTKALRRAALEGAVRVEVSWMFKPGEAAYQLRSVDAGGETIGDDRDYDILKAKMTPLERLAEASGSSKGRASLDLVAGTLEIR